MIPYFTAQYCTHPLAGCRSSPGSSNIRCVTFDDNCENYRSLLSNPNLYAAYAIEYLKRAPLRFAE